MTETQALMWIIGIVGSVMAGAITLDKVLEIIHKYVKKAKEPDDTQNKRLDGIEKRLDTIESSQIATNKALERDLNRFADQDEVNYLVIAGIRNIQKSILSGNNHAAMQSDQDALDEWLLRGASKWKRS